MSPSIDSSDSVRIRVSSGSSLIGNTQEITLKAALNRAIDLVADCFDNCNRQAEPGSLFSQQAEACEESYAVVDNHKTTLTYTENLTKHLVHSGLDYLKGATTAALETGSCDPLVVSVVNPVADRSIGRLSLVGRSDYRSRDEIASHESNVRAKL